MNGASHVFVVKTLYRRILNLHRGLPITLKALGDQYVKDEFKRHKGVTREQAQEFLQEWKVSDSKRMLNSFNIEEMRIKCFIIIIVL